MQKLLAALFWLLIVNGAALAQTPFFQGRMIRIVTGYPAGDVNDLRRRLIARHRGKYIAGVALKLIGTLRAGITIAPKISTSKAAKNPSG
jgi:hypothetical protein